MVIVKWCFAWGSLLCNYQPISSYKSSFAPRPPNLQGLYMLSPVWLVRTLYDTPTWYAIRLPFAPKAFCALSTNLGSKTFHHVFSFSRKRSLEPLKRVFFGHFRKIAKLNIDVLEPSPPPAIKHNASITTSPKITLQSFGIQLLYSCSPRNALYISFYMFVYVYCFHIFCLHFLYWDSPKSHAVLMLVVYVRPCTNQKWCVI